MAEENLAASSVSSNLSTSSEESCKKSPSVENGLLNFLYVCPLKESALVLIATRLWQVKTLDRLLRERKFPCTYQEFSVVQEEAAERLRLLGLPQTLAMEVFSVFGPVSRKLSSWLRSHKQVVGEVKYIQSICWTSLGTISERRTAESLLEIHTDLDIVHRFEIAAHACAEEALRAIWRKMTDENKSVVACRCRYQLYFCNDHLIAYWMFVCRLEEDAPSSGGCASKLFDGPYSVYKNMCNLLMSEGVVSDTENFWSRLFTGPNAAQLEDYPKDVIKSSCSVYRNMCNLMVNQANVPGIEYFWSKLSDEEKNTGGVELIELAFLESNRSRPKRESLDVITRFLLSNLRDKEQQMDAFTKYGYKITSDFIQETYNRETAPQIMIVGSGF